MNRSYTGIVKSYNHSNGYGFIDCPETKAMYGGDVFLHKNEYNGAGSEVGDEVKFQVMVSEKNQPRAIGVTPTGGGGAGGAPMVRQPMMTQQPRGAVIGRPTGAKRQATQRMYGQIRTFNQEKGFGFIECDAALRTYGTQDIFLHYTEAINFRVGDFVTFDVMTTDAGKPQARNLIAESQPPPTIQAPGARRMAGLPAPAMRRPGMKGGDPNKEHIGVVKSYNEGKGYGFIECPETSKLYGRDAFLQRDMVEMHGIAVGDEVIFKVRMKNDMPQADIVEKAEGVQNAAQNKLAQCGPGPHMGIIKSFNEGKGFGFIQCMETEDAFGCDVFLHKKENTTAGEDVGKEVQFSVVLNQKGQPQAADVQVIGDGVYTDTALDPIDAPVAKRQRIA